MDAEPLVPVQLALSALLQQGFQLHRSWKGIHWTHILNSVGRCIQDNLLGNRRHVTGFCGFVIRSFCLLIWRSFESTSQAQAHLTHNRPVSTWTNKGPKRSKNVVHGAPDAWWKRLPAGYVHVVWFVSEWTESPASTEIIVIIMMIKCWMMWIRIKINHTTKSLYHLTIKYMLCFATWWKKRKNGGFSSAKTIGKDCCSLPTRKASNTRISPASDGVGSNSWISSFFFRWRRFSCEKISQKISQKWKRWSNAKLVRKIYRKSPNWLEFKPSGSPLRRKRFFFAGKVGSGRLNRGPASKW